MTRNITGGGGQVKKRRRKFDKITDTVSYALGMTHELISGHKTHKTKTHTTNTFIEEMMSLWTVFQQITVKYFQLSSMTKFCQLGKGLQQMPCTNH